MTTGWDLNYGACLIQDFGTQMSACLVCIARVFVYEAQESNIEAVNGFVHHVDELHAVFGVVEIEDAIGDYIEYNEDVYVVFFPDVFQKDIQHFKPAFPVELKQGYPVKVGYRFFYLVPGF